ncbi:WxL domain-containing protein [Gottfriedia acidiceleris]|uniref:WxL domain-containing protein n=1 Tax=Gottfriedia acidiceleris TaxID=371036 RepID=A0ABY4JNA7_9BACI|nr:WxL domain-containing protein [Gottfriedia acidiceleris]UPM54714.1 WxL domain-containing protein [Gottfriedia acidiceleris]
MVKKRKLLFKATVLASIFVFMTSGTQPRLLGLKGLLKPTITEAATFPNLIQNPTFNFESQTTTFPNWSFLAYLNKNQSQGPYSSNLEAQGDGWYKVFGEVNPKSYVKPVPGGGILLKVLNTVDSQEYMSMRQTINTIPGKTYILKFPFKLIENKNTHPRYSWFLTDTASGTTTDREWRVYTSPQNVTTTFTAVGTKVHLSIAFEDGVKDAIDGSGFQIFQVDHVSVTVLDTEAPKITDAAITIPKDYKSGESWTNKNTTIHFTATDDHGVDPTSYEVSTDNGETWSKAGLSNATSSGVDYTVSTQGTTNILIRAKDDSGNQSNPVTDPGAKFTVKIDKELPITNYADGQLYNKNTATNITFSDALSGIDTAKLNGATISSGTINPADGEHTLDITDRAGNQTILHFTVDKTILPPVVNPITDISASITGTTEANSTVKIALPDQSFLTTKAGADGSYSVSVTPWTLYAGDVVSVTATDVAGNTSTNTNVTVTAETKNPVNPTNPTSPVEPVNPIDPDNPHEPGTKSSLSIDYVSNFHFGEHEISGSNEVYTAQLDQVKQTSDGSVIQVPNFIQVTDHRRTNTGWKLSVQQSEQFKSENNELTGAVLKLNNPILNSTTEEQYKPVATTVTLVPGGGAQDVAFADEGKGLGTWTIAYGLNSSSVTLFVPGAAYKEVGAKYKTTLTWTLADTPL